MNKHAVDDPEIFSPSNEFHIAKVKREKYFMVIDEISQALVEGKDCNIRKFKPIKRKGII